jgi:acyl phosphate:glycerol-3-phosphate acyltransferase
MHPLLGLALSYLLGSIPSAYLAGKIFRGIDLRQHGSGNLGATNVYRVMGWKIAALVMVLDVAKGALPVLIFPRWTNHPGASYWALAYGVAAIVGHVLPIFLLGKGGGKGMATAAGVFLALAPLPSVIATVMWAVVLYLWGYVSLASLSAAATLPVAVALRYGIREPVFAVSVVVCAFVFWTHRANIRRLRSGEEHRFGRKKPAV